MLQMDSIMQYGWQLHSFQGNKTESGSQRVWPSRLGLLGGLKFGYKTLVLH